MDRNGTDPLTVLPELIVRLNAVINVDIKYWECSNRHRFQFSLAPELYKDPPPGTFAAIGIKSLRLFSE